MNFLDSVLHRFFGRVQVLVNLTGDFGQVLTNLHKAEIGGTIKFSASINVARVGFGSFG